jgi:hypothetical protein
MSWFQRGQGFLYPVVSSMGGTKVYKPGTGTWMEHVGSIVTPKFIQKHVLVVDRYFCSHVVSDG